MPPESVLKSFFHALATVSMDVSNIDLNALSQALDDYDPDREHFLDRETGSLWTFVYSESTDETRNEHDAVRANDSRYLQIPSMTTQEAYEEAEDFVENVSNEGTQEALFRALEGKRAFRSFREALMQHTTERNRWSEHRRERSRQRLERFLATNGLSATSEVSLEA